MLLDEPQLTEKRPIIDWQATFKFDATYPILESELAQVEARGSIHKLKKTGDVVSAEAGEAQAAWLTVLASSLRQSATTRSPDCDWCVSLTCLPLLPFSWLRVPRCQFYALSSQPRASNCILSPPSTLPKTSVYPPLLSTLVVFFSR